MIWLCNLCVFTFDFQGLLQSEIAWVGGCFTGDSPLGVNVSSHTSLSYCYPLATPMSTLPNPRGLWDVVARCFQTSNTSRLRLDWHENASTAASGNECYACHVFLESLIWGVFPASYCPFCLEVPAGAASCLHVRDLWSRLAGLSWQPNKLTLHPRSASRRLEIWTQNIRSRS